jgi:poly(hydroxyalkanoate) depolymerase family esterase
MLTGFLAKIRTFSVWPRLKILAKLPFRGGLQAALISWRERRLESLPDDETHTFRARAYPGSRTRLYLVHVPRGTILRRSRPLVVVLHGCHQDNRDIEHISGFNQLADRHGFLVAYPFVTSYRGLRNRNCWGWWFDREIHAGSGEVEDLWQIIEEIKCHYAVDHRRIHVTGLSSGAGMAVAMMVAHADKIASGAAVAGVPYAEKAESVRHAFNRFPRHRPIAACVEAMQAEMGESPRTVPIHIVHSENDATIDIQSAKILRDSWGHCFDADTQHAYKVTNGQVGSASWEHSRYRNGSGKSVIETMFLEGPGHGWYGGNPGNHSFPDAPDIKRSIWKFFVTHRLQK